jgi:hypothetical protein
LHAASLLAGWSDGGKCWVGGQDFGKRIWHNFRCVLVFSCGVKRPTRLRLLTLAGVTVLLACALISFFRQPETEAIEPVTILSGPFVLPVMPRDRFASTLGRNRPWVARAERAFFGERKPVKISTDIVRLRASAFTNFEAALNSSTPTFNQTNALKVWFLSENQLKEFGPRILQTPGTAMLTNPQLLMADGMGGSIFTGQSVPINGKLTEVGFSMRCATIVHKDSTEMLTEIVQSELSGATVKTNLEINAHLNVPKGKGILLVKGPGDKGTNGWAFIIHPLQ